MHFSLESLIWVTSLSLSSWLYGWHHQSWNLNQILAGDPFYLCEISTLQNFKCISPPCSSFWSCSWETQCHSYSSLLICNQQLFSWKTEGFLSLSWGSLSYIVLCLSMGLFSFVMMGSWWALLLYTLMTIFNSRKISSFRRLIISFLFTL